MSGPSIDHDLFFNHLPPLPAGWDWKRFKSLSPEEWDEVPDAEKSLILAHVDARRVEWRDICGADDAARERLRQISMRSLRESGHVPLEAGLEAEQGEKNPLDITPAAEDLTPEERAIVEHYGLPLWQVGTALFEIAEVMYRTKAERWGFMLFRTCGYRSATGQARWEEYWRRVNEMVTERLGQLVAVGISHTGLQEDHEGFEERFQEIYKAAMLGGIPARFQLHGFGHETISDWGPQDVRGLFREMLKDEEDNEEEEEGDRKPQRVPQGLDVDLCLMVDEGAMSSLLDRREGRRPYVIGVLSDFNDPDVGDDIEAEYFKIALESIIDLPRQLEMQHPRDLYNGSEGKIYISPGVFEDDI